MNAHPIVSVIIPTRNYGRFLKEALDSVLQQEVPGLHVVVVDDSSEDDTSVVVAEYGDRIRYVRLDARGGTSKARNTGLALVPDGLVCFLDSDDVWLPRALPTLLEALDATPGADGACARMVNVAHEAMAEARANPAALGRNAVQAWLTGAMILRRECFERVGLFDESMPRAEFVEWISRARHAGMTFCISDELVLLRRVHGANSVLTGPSMTPSYMRMIQQHLQRQRQAGHEAAQGGAGSPRLPA